MASAKPRCPECGGDMHTGHQRNCRLIWSPTAYMTTKEKEMKDENKRYSWEPQVNCYRVEQGEELTECQGKTCNCCGRYNPVENIHTTDHDTARVKRARAQYHQDNYNGYLKGLEHAREKQADIDRAIKTLETKMEKEASELFKLLFPRH